MDEAVFERCAEGSQVRQCTMTFSPIPGRVASQSVSVCSDSGLMTLPRAHPGQEWDQNGVESQGLVNGTGWPKRPYPIRSMRELLAAGRAVTPTTV